MVHNYIQILLSLRQNLAFFSDCLDEHISKNKPQEEIQDEINIDIDKEITNQKKLIEKNQKDIDLLLNQYDHLGEKHKEALKKKENLTNGKAKKFLILMGVYFIIIGIIFFLMPLEAIGVMLGAFHIIGGLTFWIGASSVINKALSKATYDFNVIDKEYSQIKYKMDNYKENIENANYNIKKYKLMKSKKQKNETATKEPTFNLFKSYINELFSILKEKYSETNILNIEYWPNINEIINYCLENENSDFDSIDFEKIKNNNLNKNDKYDNYITLLNDDDNNVFNMYNSYVYSKLQIFELKYGNPFAKDYSLEKYIKNNYQKFNNFDIYNFKDVITKYNNI